MSKSKTATTSKRNGATSTSKKVSAASARKRLKEVEGKYRSERINLGEFESVHLILTDKDGNNLYRIEMDRRVEETPTLQFAVFAPDGEFASNFWFFDLPV